jgi:hypothetical protein
MAAKRRRFDELKALSMPKGKRNKEEEMSVRILGESQ